MYFWCGTLSSSEVGFKCYHHSLLLVWNSILWKTLATGNFIETYLDFGVHRGHSILMLDSCNFENLLFWITYVIFNVADGSCKIDLLHLLSFYRWGGWIRYPTVVAILICYVYRTATGKFVNSTTPNVCALCVQWTSVHCCVWGMITSGIRGLRVNNLELYWNLRMNLF